MVTFIAPSFNEEFDPYVFIGAMLCQKNKNWKAVIYNNGPNPRLKWLVNSYNDERLIYRESETNTGCWGCYNRSDAIHNIVDTEYIVQTSVQDYWLPNAVDAILQHTGADFIYWNSINHLAGYHNTLYTMPILRYIDWGNFAIKTEIARKVGIRHPEAFTADGQFVQDCIAEGLLKNTVKLNQILTIHN